MSFVTQCLRGFPPYLLVHSHFQNVFPFLINCLSSCCNRGTLEQFFAVGHKHLDTSAGAPELTSTLLPSIYVCGVYIWMSAFACVWGHIYTYVQVFLKAPGWYQESSSMVLHLTHWDRVSQLNQTSLILTYSDRPLALRFLFLCPPRSRITGCCTLTWHLCEYLGAKPRSSCLLRKHLTHRATKAYFFLSSNALWIHPCIITESLLTAHHAFLQRQPLLCHAQCWGNTCSQTSTAVNNRAINISTHDLLKLFRTPLGFSLKELSKIICVKCLERTWWTQDDGDDWDEE